MVEVKFKPADVGTVADGSITNAKVSGTAAIVQSKLVNIVNADIAAGAAIVKTKLAALGIVDADVAAGAAIADGKLNEEYVKGAVTDTTGDKKVIAIGWDNVTAEVIVDHAA